MKAIIELSRGHSESQIKSDRIGRAWAEKKRLARENGETLTHQLPRRQKRVIVRTRKKPRPRRPKRRSRSTNSSK